MSPTDPETESANAASSSKEAESNQSQIEPLRLPTIEEIRGQDIWNNCAVRSVVSGVMGNDSIPACSSFFGFFKFHDCCIRLVLEKIDEKRTERTNLLDSLLITSPLF